MNAPIERLLRSPEAILLLFAFLFNFVFEVAQTPYYVIPQRGDPQAFVLMLFHCSGGDALITLGAHLVVAGLQRDRFWLLKLNPGSIVAFSALGLGFTAIVETYRVQVLVSYGVPPVFAVPWLGIHWFALLQWATLPAVVLLLTRRYLMGYGIRNPG